ncbi:hypothetical protein KKI24_19520 [bacterium]|nr:hypothetical protein [bacterium]
MLALFKIQQRNCQNMVISIFVSAGSIHKPLIFRVAMEKVKRKKNLRRTRVSFKPNREFIGKAVEDYLNGGGKITRLFPGEKSYQNMMMSRNQLFEADDYLSGYNDR